jgi:hypothetical protein
VACYLMQGWEVVCCHIGWKGEDLFHICCVHKEL